jgi:hypothetical protein
VQSCSQTPQGIDVLIAAAKLLLLKRPVGTVAANKQAGKGHAVRCATGTARMLKGVQDAQGWPDIGM